MPPPGVRRRPRPRAHTSAPMATAAAGGVAQSLFARTQGLRRSDRFNPTLTISGQSDLRMVHATVGIHASRGPAYGRRDRAGARENSSTGAGQGRIRAKEPAAVGSEARRGWRARSSQVGDEFVPRSRPPPGPERDGGWTVRSSRGAGNSSQGVDRRRGWRRNGGWMVRPGRGQGRIQAKELAASGREARRGLDGAVNRVGMRTESEAVNGSSLRRNAIEIIGVLWRSSGFGELFAGDQR